MITFSPKLLGGAIAFVGGGAILGALFIGAGAAAWGPRTVPMLAGALMLLAGLATMIERPEPRQSDAPARELHAVYLVLLAAGYVLAIGLIGYILATAIAALAFLWLFGTRTLGRLLAAAILCPTALHLFFFEILGIFPPRAAWDLADHLPF
ncbi:MAG: tripartite tricarboxylate transporter TctB family protein [Pseudomonadota bacterium]